MCIFVCVFFFSCLWICLSVKYLLSVQFSDLLRTQVHSKYSNYSCSTIYTLSFINQSQKADTFHCIHDAFILSVTFITNRGSFWNHRKWHRIHSNSQMIEVSHFHISPFHSNHSFWHAPSLTLSHTHTYTNYYYFFLHKIIVTIFVLI